MLQAAVEEAEVGGDLGEQVVGEVETPEVARKEDVGQLQLVTSVDVRLVVEALVVGARPLGSWKRLVRVALTFRQFYGSTKYGILGNDCIQLITLVQTISFEFCWVWVWVWNLVFFWIFGFGLWVYTQTQTQRPKKNKHQIQIQTRDSGLSLKRKT